MGQQGNRLMTEVAGVGDKTEGSKMWKQTQPGRSPFCALCVCVLLYDVVVNVSRCVRVALCLCECEGWWGWIWGDGVEQYRMFFFVLLLVASFRHCLGGGDGGGGGGSGELTYTHKKIDIRVCNFGVFCCCGGPRRAIHGGRARSGRIQSLLLLLGADRTCGWLCVVY